MMATMSVSGAADAHTQMNTYRSYVTMLADAGAKDEIKLKAAQELSENFEVILSSPQYPQFLDHSLKIFLKILQEGEPHFIAEYNIQQVRKLILEMIHRLPISETLRPYVKNILILMLKLMEIENEENVLVCLKIFMELHKQYRPVYSTEVDIHKFLQWVKGIYSDLPNHLPKIFEPKPTIRVKDLSEVNIDQLLQETYTTTPIHTEKKLLDGSVVTYNLIPRSVLSLKVIQELPIIVVLMYQLYKQNVHQEVSNFIPLIMETITLQPAATHRQSASFNKEVFVDFMGAQIKTLAFLAYIIRIYQDTIANHANLMVKGIIGLLTLCPPEVAHLRKELVIATRHILATDLRLKFVPYMERLFDEDVLLGGGWTVHESLRPLAYSTLADLVHHVRQHLPLSDLAIAAHLFSKNVHDESLPTSIQTMSCKLLLNLVDCIRQRSESEGAAGAQPQGRQLLMRILEVFVLKFKTISKLQLPALMNKCSPKSNVPGAATTGSSTACSAPSTSLACPSGSTTPGTPTTPVPTPSTPEIKVEDEKPLPDFLDTIAKNEEKSKIGFPSTQMQNLNVGDYRTLVKTLVCGVKTITWGCASCKSTAAGEGTSSTAAAGQKQFTARETLVFIRLVRWGLQSLDIYTLAAPRAPAHAPAQPHVRSKEEKEVLEHFSGVFSMMNPQTFQEIFTATISHMVERINKNMTLQIIANTFLSNPATSPIFATVLVEYLLKRMEEMGTNVERSNLYLRLFKLVFGSVSLFPSENEQMLRPHLHSIVNKAMDYAMTAKEPYNYFLLLRALFRSIGGGSHDLLYQEFLPLLPNLLEGLNRLQSGLHKQHMKDLFVELCLTVPVRLSSLLPYLPMLMDPLVSALNGSHTLISQGLRTLELCVDNLQPDFLYEHIQPVRADLMQALWRTLHNSEVARIAFRVLGKFGGGNRKMMIEPQRLEYRETDVPPPAIQAYFQDQAKPIDFEVDKVIDTAFTALKSSATDPFYRKQCWEVLRCYLVASLNLDDDRETLQKLFNHPTFSEGKIQAQNGPYYKCTNTIVRNTHRTALTGMFVAAAIKDLRQQVLPTMVALVRHYSMVAIAQEAGPFAGTASPKEGLDALVLIDAIAIVMGHEEKELCKPGHLALVLIIETAATITGSKERACRLPLMEYLAERMSALCYERAWYAKLGGCIAVKFMCENMAPEWVYRHVFAFLKGVLFIMMDLTGEVSSGAIDQATQNLEKLVMVCVTPPTGVELEPEVVALQKRALNEILPELVLQITSPHLLVRQEAMKSLELIAKLQNKTVTEVMDPHREVIADILPPKKHLLRHQPANCQMGLMDGTTFCTTLKPRLFTIDLNVNEHKIFFRELLSLCEAEDAMLGKLPCYKGVNLVPLRASALRALASCHYIQEKHCREKIFQVLYKSLEKNDPELQQAGFECMQKFLAGFQIDMEMVHPVMRPLLLTLGDHRHLSVNGAKRLSYLTQLFPSTFSEKLCEQLLQLLKKLLDYSIQTNRGGNFLQSVSKNMENEQKIIILIGIFHQIPAASPRFIDVLCRLIFHTEKSLMIEAGSPFREPLVKFLLRYPKETLDLILSDNNIKDQQWSRFLVFLIKHPEAGKAYRDALQTAKKPRLMQLLAANTAGTASAIPQADKSEMQFQAIRVISLLIKFDDQWLSTQQDLIELLKRIWCTDQYHDVHKKVEVVDCTHWKEPKLIVKILLHYFCHHPSNIDLLFQLLRALCDRFIPDFQFLRDFLENTVAQNYTLEWKRSAFFRFVEHFSTDTMSQELKAKVLQMILIPCFAVSFEKGQKIVGGAPAPYQDNPDNVVSVFINNVIDPENPFACSDAVRISLLQFACLLLEQASAHIHDANNKKQGNKLRRLMTFAWPCLLGKNYVDPATRYHGHLLLSHIIAKFAIHKRIVLQVFHSLLKAHAVEARGVVRQALEILTPAMPQRMEDGNTMLTHWTKKIIVEDGHSVQQLFHILQLVVRHYKVYFPVRHALVGHMVTAMQRLGFSATASLEHRRLAVDLAEVALKWELQRIRDHSSQDNIVATSPSGAMKRMSSDESGTESRKALNTGWASPQASVSRLEPDAAKPLDRQHVDVVVNLLLRLACQVNEGGAGGGATAGAAGGGGASPGEALSRRCVLLLRAALKPDVWPHHCDPKLAWLDKVFSSAESNAASCANACTALELLVFLLGVLRREQILAALKPLQRGLSACVSSTNAKIVRLTHNLLAKLTAIFPTEPTGTAQASKYEELETLYACVSKYAFEGLATYEKSAGASSGSGAGAGGGAGALLGPLMMLKACCTSSPSYIDRLITPLMRVLQRMARDHVAPNPDSATSDLLILALDLLKTRVSVMAPETRKTFIGTVLVGLIEKTTDAKVMKAITRMVEEWVKQRSATVTASNAGAPSLREKSILLVKLMQYVEKRFPDDQELNAQFLEMINYVYRDEHLKVTELSMKLEPAFLAGLRCPQPAIRAKFFEVYDGSVRKRIFDRLLYIICSQNWEHIGQHYWIKQCLELLLVTCVTSTQIRLSNTKYLLPCVSSVINTADSEERKLFSIYTTVKEESSDGFSDSMDPDKEDVLDMDLDSSSNQKDDLVRTHPNRKRLLNQIIAKQAEFLEVARRVRTAELALAAAQLCHMDDTLAHHTATRLLPALWHSLDDRQLGTIMNEIVPFIISGVHVIQRDQPLSALNTFIEALARCNPPISIKPPMMKYLGKTHNLWHRMTLNLEQMAIDQAAGRAPREQIDIYDYETETTTPTEILDSLSDMYELLQEEDMWSGLWQKHARYRETNMAIAYEQQGFYEQAQAAYDVAMAKYKNEYAANPSSVNMHKECTLWTQHWLKCAKELNQWDSLLEIGLTRSGRDPFLILESSWRNPNWTTMKDALAEVEYNCPKELAWLVNLYRGYLCICAGGEQQLSGVERHAEAAAAQCLREWRRLPRLVAHAHLPLLRAAQQLMELSEAAQIHTGLLHSRPTSLHDMKAIVKTWRNRLPVVADPLSHWGAIFTWRQHHYQFIASHYDSQAEHASNHSMLGVHASAQAIIHFAKIARKHNLSGVCLDSLHRIYTIPSVPIVDCFQKIRQQVKCHIQMSWTEGKDELQEGLDMIESTNFKYFTKEMTAEFYAFKGLLLAQLGRSEDANKAFAAAVQLHDTLVKAWALWGDYLEQIFIRDPRQISVGVSAMTCFLHACRHQNESKSRKYCAKVLWMLSFDDEKNSLAEALDKYSVGVPPVQWLPWIPQLLACLVQYDGSVILNLLSHVGRLYPQAVYFPIRTLYLTLKIEQRERHKTAENIAAGQLPSTSASTSKVGEGGATSAAGGAGAGAGAGEAGPIKATLPMWRCSKIMQLQREIHPTILSSLEGIVDQMVWFRENWYEEILRQLRAGLAKCHVVAYHHRAAVADATVTPHTLHFIKKVVSSFGLGIGITVSENLARRAQATIQDPIFQKMKNQFTADFDFSQPNAMKLQNLIQKLRKWVKILETKTKILPKSFLIEEKCRFLSNFSLKTAEVELPGEFLLPKHTHYHVRIARFMPRVEIVQKHNTYARRLYIRGHNGKIYPYLVVNDSGLGDARREERVLQLLRMLNHYLGKQKETSRRFLHFTVPRVVSVSPQMRLVEDNPSSISLLDIYRTECANRGVEYDAPIARYYERLAAVQARGSQASQQVLRDILREVQATMVPKGMVREWAAATFSSPTDYWTFRKMLTLQMSLASFAEYVLHLTRLNPDMMYVHQDSGLLNVSYFKFDVDDATGELDCNRPVPFRLTPNISELLTNIGITGPLTASAISVARCLVTPNFKIQSILRTILRDEMVTGYRKRLEDKSGLPTAGTSTENKPVEMDNETIINMVNKAVTVIMNRLNSLAVFDGPDSKVATLVTAANSHDNLCRMDPAWHPWL